MTPPTNISSLRTRIRQSRQGGDLCFVCGQEIPNGAGLYHAGFGVRVHYETECDRRLRAVERDYSTSKRGRWRPKLQTLAQAMLPEGEICPCSMCESQTPNGGR